MPEIASSSVSFQWVRSAFMPPIARIRSSRLARSDLLMQVTWCRSGMSYSLQDRAPISPAAPYRRRGAAPASSGLRGIPFNYVPVTHPMGGPAYDTIFVDRHSLRDESTFH